MSYRRICFASLLLAAACGGISDPSHSNGPAPTKVTGTLKGADGTTAPANARLAVIWRKGINGGFSVGADVPIQNGTFQLSLTVPPNDYFFSPNDGTAVKLAPPPSESGGGVAPGGDTANPPGDIKPLSDGTIGGSVAGEMTTAIAGFVVYRDENGNGQLDLDGSTISSNDVMIGGNRELAITYLRGGGTLDYEKLRDRAGILPTAGFNLFWTEGRWLPLSLVELKIDPDIRMASEVCAGGQEDIMFTDGPTSPSVPPEPRPDPNPYPNPSDVTCDPDGYGWTYNNVPECYSPPPPPPGICFGGGDEPGMSCAAPSGGRLPKGTDVPEGWPCPVEGDAGLPHTTDAGTSTPDAGVIDAAKGG